MDSSDDLGFISNNNTLWDWFRPTTSHFLWFIAGGITYKVFRDMSLFSGCFGGDARKINELTEDNSDLRKRLSQLEEDLKYQRERNEMLSNDLSKNDSTRNDHERFQAIFKKFQDDKVGMINKHDEEIFVIRKEYDEKCEEIRSELRKAREEIVEGMKRTSTLLDAERKRSNESTNKLTADFEKKIEEKDKELKEARNSSIKIQQECQEKITQMGQELGETLDEMRANYNSTLRGKDEVVGAALNKLATIYRALSDYKIRSMEARRLYMAERKQEEEEKSSVTIEEVFDE